MYLTFINKQEFFMKNIIRFSGSVSMVMCVLFSYTAFSEPSCVGTQAPKNMCFNITNESDCGNYYNEALSEANNNSADIQCAWVNGSCTDGQYCVGS
jgi:hypothetical protein